MIPSRVLFAAIHQVGSDNDLEPWFGDEESAEDTARRLAEYEERNRAIEDDSVWLRLRVDPRDPAVFGWEEVVVR